MRALRRAVLAPYIAGALGAVAFLAAQVDDDLAVTGHIVWSSDGGMWGWRLLCVVICYLAYVGIYAAGRRAGSAGL